MYVYLYSWFSSLMSAMVIYMYYVAILNDEASDLMIIGPSLLLYYYSDMRETS